VILATLVTKGEEAMIEVVATSPLLTETEVVAETEWKTDESALVYT